MKQKQDVRPHTFGLSLLLVVFLVLCLLTFAAISVAEARNDITGAQKKLEKTIGYNTAANEAELTIADYTAEAMANPAAAAPSIEFSVSIDDNDELDITIELTEDETTGEAWYRITRWQVVSNAEWTANETLEVLPDGRIGW